MPVRKQNRVTTPKWAVLNGTKSSHASMPRARGRWRLDRTRNRGSAPGSEARTPTQEATTVTQLEDAVNSDERDYGEEAACQPLMAGEHAGEGPSGDHLPDCEMFTDYGGPAGRLQLRRFPVRVRFQHRPGPRPVRRQLRVHPARSPGAGGRRIHRGVSPLPGPGPEPQYVVAYVYQVNGMKIGELARRAG